MSNIPTLHQFAHSMLWSCEWTEGLEEEAKAYGLGCEETIGHMFACWLTQSGYTPQGCETSVAADYIPWGNLPKTHEGWIECLNDILMKNF